MWLCDYHVTQQPHALHDYHLCVSVRSSPRTQGGTVPDQIGMITELLMERAT